MAQDEIDLLLRSVPDVQKPAPRLGPRAPKQRDAIDDLLDGVPDEPRARASVSAALTVSSTPKLSASKSPAPAPSQAVDPRLDSFVNDVIGEAARRSGYTYKLGDGVRSPEQQAQKVAQGNSWTMNSRHLHGRGRDVLAFDERGNYITDGAHPAYAALGEVSGERAASAPAPVRWGVVRDGQQVDPGHFELGETDAIDDLLSTLPDEERQDPIDALLETVPDDDVDERVNASPAVATPAAPKLPPLEGADIYSTEGRAQRDAAAASRVRAVTVPLTRSLADYTDSASLMADAYREGARALNVDPSFAEEWIKSHPNDMRLIGSPAQPDATPADLLGSSVHDATRNTVRLELGGLADLERDYKAQRSTSQRVVDFVTDDTTTAGEKFLNVSAPVVGAAGRAGDLATRPLQASSTALWSLARKHSPSQAVKDAYEEFRTGETPEGADNWIAEQAHHSETLKAANPNLPGLVSGFAEMLTDPANLIPLGMLAKGGAALKGLKGVQKIERALLASRDARALEFFNAGGRVLKLEQKGDGFIVALADADGVTHRIDMSAFYSSGQKPKLVSRRAGEEIEGVGLERDGDTGRVFHNGRPQDFVMDSETGLRASPVGGGGSTRRAAMELRAAERELGRLQASASSKPEVVAAMNERVTRLRSALGVEPKPPSTFAAKVDTRSASSALPDLTDLADQPLPLAAPLTPGQKIRKLARDVRDVINLTKAIPASFDNSALMGQGAIIVGARPSLAPGAIGDAARSAMSRGKFADFKRKLVTHPNQQLREDSGLYLASIGKGEETFGSRFAEKIPGVAASQRAYEATLDSLRSHAFDLYAERLTKAGVTDPKAFKDIARWVNVATGRGEMGTLESLADVLNLPMFSPRLLASKFNIISPVRYARMHPAARRIALTEMFRASGSLATTMGLAKLAGASVDLDPFSGGFGTIDADGTSYDLSGGRLRALRFAAQIADSLNKQRRGEPVKEGRTPAALTKKFFRAYLAPAGQLAVDWQTGENFDGSEFRGDWRELDRLAPFAAKEMSEAYQKAGVTGAVKAAPAFAGVGVHTFDKSGAPIKPSLSEPVQAEIDRLGLDLTHLGKDGKKSAAIKPAYQTEGVTGDSFRTFGGVTGKPGREVSGMGIDAKQTASELSAELEAALGEIISSPDYESFESDEDRAQYLDMIILNIHKRVMNGVRRDARGLQLDKEQKVKERLDRMSAGSRTSGQRNFKL